MKPLTTFAVNEPFPIPGMIPPREGCILEMTSAGPLVICQMPGLRREELRAFRKSFKRYSYLDYTRESVPLAVWVFRFPGPFNSIDLNFNARLVDPEWIDDYLDVSEGVKNAIDFILLDGKIVRGLKRAGLDPEAVKLFHNTIRKQIASDYTPADYDAALGGLFTRTTDELFKMGTVFKKQGEYMANDIEELLDRIMPLDDNHVNKDIMILEELKSGKHTIDNGVQAVKDAILKQAPEPEQGVFSFLPTTLARISPFFPMSRKELKTRPFKAGMTWEHPWGKITVDSGNECLAIYDESVLLAILELAKESQSEEIQISTYTLAKRMEKNPNKRSYKAIWESLARLMRTILKVEIWDGKGQGRKPKKVMMGNILSYAQKDEETNNLEIVLNIYFVKMFGAGFITNLDLKLRASLKGDIAKALYRFFQSHRDYEYRCHFLTIAGAVNLNTAMPHTEIKKRLRKGLAELRKAGYLKRWTMPKDIMTVWKSGKPKRLG